MRKTVAAGVVGFGLLGTGIVQAETVDLIGAGGAIVGSVESLGVTNEGKPLLLYINDTNQTIYVTSSDASNSRVVALDPDGDLIRALDLSVDVGDALPVEVTNISGGTLGYGASSIEMYDVGVNLPDLSSTVGEPELQLLIGSNTSSIQSNDADITANTTAIDGNDTDIAANTTAVQSNDTDIAANTTAIEGNDTDIAANTTAIEGNDTDIAANTTAIEGNDTDIAANTTAIEGNDTDIADLQAVISTTSSDLAIANQAIQSNSQAILDNTTTIGLNSKGIAESMAFGMIQQDVNHDGFQLSIGAASFNGYSGFAFVGGAKVSNNAFVSAGVTGSGNYAASVNFKW